MANKKFSEFVLKTSTSDVSHIVGYNGAENVQITPANFVTGGGAGVFLPLAGGTMTGDTTHNDNVKSVYGTLGDGLEIFHNSANSFIKDTGTGGLRIQGRDTIILEDTSLEAYIYMERNDKVELYYDGSAKLATTSTGISVTGNATVGTGVINESIGGDIAITQGAVGIRINDSASAITPTTATSNNDDVVDLGTSNIRFKDLHLAGSGNFGGNIEIDSTLPTIIMTDTDSGGFARIRASNGGLLLESDENNTQADSTTRFEIDGSEKMRLDASGNLGLGTSSPADKLSISSSTNQIGLDTGDIAADGTLDIGLFSNGAFIGTQSGTNTAADILRFGTSGTERIRIDSAGNVGVGNSNPSQVFVVKDGIVVTGATSEAASTTGDYILAVGKNAGDKSLHTQGDILCDGGIFLGGTVAANKLDNYEEGTWTPEISAQNAPSGVTYNFRSGSYTRIGNKVWVRMGVNIANVGTGGSGVILLTGLPFTSKNEGSYTEPTAMAIGGRWVTAVNAGNVYAFVQNSSQQFQFRTMAGNADNALNYSELIGGASNVGTWFTMQCFYQIA